MGSNAFGDPVFFFSISCATPALKAHISVVLEEGLETFPDEDSEPYQVKVTYSYC